MHLAFHNCQQMKLTFESLHISVDLRCFGFVCTRVGWYFDYFDCKMIEITCNDRLGKKVSSYLNILSREKWGQGFFSGASEVQPG